MEKKEKIRKEMNRLGQQGKPFVFLIDFSMEEPVLFAAGNTNDLLHWQTMHSSSSFLKRHNPSIGYWIPEPESFNEYRKGFDLIQHHIHNGDTYLINYTRPTPVRTNLDLEDIYSMSKAPYKILFRNRFTCFSPEPFVRIENGKIYSFPMKGTIEATKQDSAEHILNDPKELAEHNTIVDLIRNDLSLVASHVTVEQFRYLQCIKTNRKDLWQVSSRIAGQLPHNFTRMIGDILFTLLPAGSVTGAPKDKTLEITVKAEKYNRGYYTGIFGIFDGKDLDSCVLIRFIEKQDNRLIFKSGGGITFMSDAETEYNEMINKVYVAVG